MDKKEFNSGKLTAITNARIFNGERVIDEQSVIIDGWLYEKWS